MESIYHSGERYMQEKAGAGDAAVKIGRMVLPVIAHLYLDFIHSQPFVILGAADGRGLAWCSVLSSSSGFMKFIEEQTLSIEALPDAQDPFSGIIRQSQRFTYSTSVSGSLSV